MSQIYIYIFDFLIGFERKEAKKRSMRSFKCAPAHQSCCDLFSQGRKNIFPFHFYVQAGNLWPNLCENVIIYVGWRFANFATFWQQQQQPKMSE
jgi:hypothetical protein